MWTPDASVIITREQREAEVERAAWETLRAERDRLLDAADKLVRRHSDQIDLGITPTLSARQYTDLLIYRQSLRDMPEKTVDPLNPTWPMASG